MALRFDIGWLLAAFLVSIRVAGGVALTPVLGPIAMPAPVRAVVTVALAALLVSALPIAPVSVGLEDLMVAAGVEALIGASLAFGFLAAQTATQIAGRILDAQMGFGAASLLNPAMRTPAPPIASLFAMLAVAVFLALDGHHVIIQALRASLEAFPPGVTALDLDIEAIVAQSAAMFAFGLALAGPVMVALLIADVGMAVIARSMPQLNVFVLSFSVKILLGLLGLVASVGAARAVLTSLFESTFRYWDGITVGV